MWCSSWLVFFSSWSLAGVPRKSALVVKNLTRSRPRSKHLWDRLFFTVREKNNRKTADYSQSWYQELLNENLRGDGGSRFTFLVNLHSNSSFYGLSTDVYLYRFDCDDRMCVCEPVVYWGGLSLLHQVLDARQWLLYWHSGIRAAGLLGKLQDGHVAQRAHFPHFQPFNEAPAGMKKQHGHSWGRVNSKTI